MTSSTVFCKTVSSCCKYTNRNPSSPHTSSLGRCHFSSHPSELTCLQVFNYIITAAIVANIIILASTAYGESAAFTKAKEDCNYAFTAIFIVEAAVKVTGLGWHNYWRSGWNKFDFFLILMAIVDIIFTQTVQGAQVSHFGAVASVVLDHDVLL